MVVGVRGAIDIPRDTAEEVDRATRELLAEMMERNRLEPQSLAAVFFTATPDIRSEFPALAARRMGLSGVPLMCSQEMAVHGALPRCIRVLMLVNGPLPAGGPQHVYLRGATALRPDIASPPVTRPSP
ncbi:MAG: chorismate mutase [Syntrophomonadaceae bacterium]|jgi:chorismate mutase|nr:chorismate mutase [Syntrophomonadaceae bacterium]